MCYSSWVHYTTSCNTHSSSPEDGQNNCPKHVDLTGIINKPLLLHLVSCLYYLYQRCTVKKILDNEIYLLIKYIKSVLWRVAKRVSYIEDARCLKVKMTVTEIRRRDVNWFKLLQPRPVKCGPFVAESHVPFRAPVYQNTKIHKYHGW